MTDALHHQLNDIPLLYMPGDERLVIWLPGFSGDKDACLPQLRSLARRGFTALSFDPYQHGERMTETREALAQRVTGNIRRYFWTILACHRLGSTGTGYLQGRYGLHLDGW